MWNSYLIQQTPDNVAAFLTREKQSQGAGKPMQRTRGRATSQLGVAGTLKVALFTNGALGPLAPPFVH